MKSIIKALDSLDMIVKLILAIFGDIIWNFYRLCRSIQKNNIIGIILAVILLCTGGLVIVWIIDIITIITGNKVVWID